MEPTNRTNTPGPEAHPTNGSRRLFSRQLLRPFSSFGRITARRMGDLGGGAGPAIAGLRIMVQTLFIRHLLVVDDDADSADALAALLRLALPHWDVAVAYNGWTAVEFARHSPLEVVVLDIEMPRLDGFDTAAAMRAVTQGTLPVTVAVSGNPSKLATALVSGVFDRALPKPINVAQLKAMCEPF